MEEELTTGQQAESSPKSKTAHLAPYQFKKGQSGNPSGRRPGKSLREYAKEMIASMTDEERQEYLQGIDKKTIWEMAEGKAHQAIDHTTGGLPLILPATLIQKNDGPT